MEQLEVLGKERRDKHRVGMNRLFTFAICLQMERIAG